MKRERGFSLVEMLVVITIIGILAAIAIPNMTRVRIKAKEAEVKASIHVIQEAIERYYVDEKEYPEYLIGGSNTSWPIFQNRTTTTDFPFYFTRTGRDKIYDPLIEFNYVTSYPKNPFTDEDKGGIYLVASGGSMTEPASGDPRFGLKGTVMCNSVDDPLFFLTGPGEKAETLNLAGTSTIDNYGSYGGLLVASGPETFILSGSFFYRAEGPIDMANVTISATPNRRDFPYKNYSRYILGGFGSDTTKGLDIYRVTNTGNGLYLHQPGTEINFPWDIPVILPEVFGGGNHENNPYFPYEPVNDGVDFYYGAPDGLEDGVVIALTDAGENFDF